jgi:hypothetical protein
MADIPHFVSATQRDEWDSSHQTHSVEFWKAKKLKFISFSPTNGGTHGFSGPYLPRRVAQAK